MEGFLYLVRNPNLWKENIHKIGKTKDWNSRKGHYGKEAKLFRLVWDKDMNSKEKELIQSFAESFERANGNEYFACSEKEAKEKFDSLFVLDSETFKISFSKDGTKKETMFSDGKKHGKQKKMYVNGKRKETEYENGKKYGMEVVWFSNGRKEKEKYYVSGKKHGKFCYWNDDGTKRKTRNYVSGKKTGI